MAGIDFLASGTVTGKYCPYSFTVCIPGKLRISIPVSKGSRYVTVIRKRAGCVAVCFFAFLALVICAVSWRYTVAFYCRPTFHRANVGLFSAMREFILGSVFQCDILILFRVLQAKVIGYFVISRTAYSVYILNTCCCYDNDVPGMSFFRRSIVYALCFCSHLIGNCTCVFIFGSAG